MKVPRRVLFPVKFGFLKTGNFGGTVGTVDGGVIFFLGNLELAILIDYTIES